jgi:hypothetical protein
VLASFFFFFPDGFLPKSLRILLFISFISANLYNANRLPSLYSHISKYLLVAVIVGTEVYVVLRHVRVLFVAQLAIKRSVNPRDLLRAGFFLHCLLLRTRALSRFSFFRITSKMRILLIITELTSRCSFCSCVSSFLDEQRLPLARHGIRLPIVLFAFPNAKPFFLQLHSDRLGASCK